MKTENLESVARKLVAPGKGILAADESTPTIEKRLKSIDVASTEENRRAYRDVLFSTAGVGEFISGVILFDETIRQKTRDGRTFIEALEQQAIIPGIKVDKGAKPMANFPGEKITEGLDGLRERLAEYRQLGARFAKWRAVIGIGEKIPTRRCIELACYRTSFRGHRANAAKRFPSFVRVPCCTGSDAPETEHGAFRERLPAASFGAGSS
jgi:fructose-bisphosphate aldolase, class I